MDAISQQVRFLEHSDHSGYLKSNLQQLVMVEKKISNFELTELWWKSDCEFHKPNTHLKVSIMLRVPSCP